MTRTDNELRALTADQRRQFDWLGETYLEKIINALEAVEAACVRFVGGCVRDTLMGAAPKDFDVATTLEPDVVIAALKAAGLSSAPTGIAHGTITGIVDGHGVEITTLRADVSTDGRRATVAFTKDWHVDATRRDFCVNAIYLTPDGRLFDPVGGVKDANERRVRFIGKAENRIREDYLRILRFFRFSARFAGAFDSVGLAACEKLSDGIATLSSERVGAEFSAILALPRAAAAVEAMATTGVLAHIWPAAASIDVLQRLKKIAPAAAAPLGLAALYGDAGDGIDSRLRLANAEKSRRKHVLMGASLIDRGLSRDEARVMIYRYGADRFSDALLIAAAHGRIDAAAHSRFSDLAKSWTAPSLPVFGRHIVAAGIAPGPAVAALLSAIEEAWIAEGFPDAARARAILADKLAAHHALDHVREKQNR